MVESAISTQYDRQLLSLTVTNGLDMKKTTSNQTCPNTDQLGCYKYDVYFTRQSSERICWPTSSTTWITNLYARIACCSTDIWQHQTLRVNLKCHYLLFRRGLRANKKKLKYIANQNVNLLPAREDVLNKLKLFECGFSKFSWWLSVINFEAAK